jgi:hypothetical protein
MNGLDEWVALVARLFALLVFVGLLWPATLALLEPAQTRLHRIRLFVVAALVLLSVVQIVSIWVSAQRIISGDVQAVNVVAITTAFASAGVAAFGLFAFWPRAGDES